MIGNLSAMRSHPKQSKYVSFTQRMRKKIKKLKDSERSKRFWKNQLHSLNLFSPSDVGDPE